MPFAEAMIWTEPIDHISGYYLCMVTPIAKELSKKWTVQYPIIPSALHPVPHNENIPVTERKKIRNQMKSSQMVEKTMDTRSLNHQLYMIKIIV